MHPCTTPISSSELTSEGSRLPSEEAIFPKDIAAQEDKTRKKVYVSQRSEELNNIEDSNQIGKTAADDGWDDKNGLKSPIKPNEYLDTSNEKPTKKVSQRPRHRLSGERRFPQSQKQYPQSKLVRSKSGNDSIIPKLAPPRSYRTPYSSGPKWGKKYTPVSQRRPMTCPSGPSKFTFASPLARSGTKNWSQLVWESRFKKSVTDLQTIPNFRPRKAYANKPHPQLSRGYYHGCENQYSNYWGQSPTSQTWGHSPHNMPAISPHYGVDDRHFFMDLLGGMPMPITPPSPMSPLLPPLDTSMGFAEYYAGLNKIDTSPKNPDAFVMNTPSGQFIRGSNGKWFPLPQQRQSHIQESNAYEEAILKDAREKKKKADRDFGTWCKNRQARSEFVAAITKAATDPTIVEGAVE